MAHSTDQKATEQQVTKQTGQCLCGAVRITTKNASQQVGVCHCNMCHKWNGGPFFAIGCGDDVLFEGEENITVFESSEWAERGFCGRCGTHLFYRLKERRQHMMPPGLFENYKDLVFSHQVFIDEKPSFYSFAEQTKDLTGAEIFAKFKHSRE